MPGETEVRGDVKTFGVGDSGIDGVDVDDVNLTTAAKKLYFVATGAAAKLS